MRTVSGIVALCLVSTAFAFGAPMSAGADETADCASVGAILGTDGPDTLYGTTGPDIICGLGGNDTIYGYGGNDTIYAGTGNDVVDAGDGNDTVYFGDGGDTGIGGPGADKLFGGNGSDALNAAEGDDFLYGDAGDDTVNGGIGNDKLVGDVGSDTIIGGSGNDSMVGGDGIDAFEGDEGVNYCDNVAGETASTCFFDNAKPVVTGYRVVNPTVTITGDVGQTLYIDVTITDQGVGIPSAQQRPISAIMGGVFIDIYGENGSNGGGRAPTPELISGDAWSGTWRVPVYVNPNVQSRKLHLQSLAVSDSVGNRRLLIVDKDVAEVVNDALGVPEKVKPTITALAFDQPQRTFDATDERRYLSGTFTAQDSSGVFRIWVMEKGSSNGVPSSPLLFARNNDNRCSDGFDSWKSDVLADLAVPYTERSGFNAGAPDIVNRITGSMGQGAICRVSGDAKSGTYRFIYAFESFFALATTTLDITAQDFSGNKSAVASTQVMVTNSRVDYSDVSAPTLNSIAITPTSVNTGSDAQIVTVRANVRDIGNGTSSGRVEFWRTSSTGAILGSFALSFNQTGPFDCVGDGDTRTATQPTAQKPSTFCWLSGDVNNAVVEMKILLPAHFPRGKYQLAAFTGIDLITRNQSDWDAKRIKSRGLAVSLTNG